MDLLTPLLTMFAAPFILAVLGVALLAGAAALFAVVDALVYICKALRKAWKSAKAPLGRTGNQPKESDCAGYIRQPAPPGFDDPDMFEKHEEAWKKSKSEK